MARKNPIIEQLKEDLRRANLKAENEKELRLRKEGQLEKYEEEEERRKEDRHMMVREREEYTRRLESDVEWMRRLVEQLCVPADKLEVLEKVRVNQVQITGDGRYPRPY